MNSVNRLPRWLNIGLVFPLLFLNGWLLLLLCNYLEPLVSTVVAASLISFLLDYPILLLGRRGVKRGIAVGLVLIMAVLLLSVLILVLGPIIFQQLVELGNRLPAWLEDAEVRLAGLREWAIAQQLPIEQLPQVNLDGLLVQVTDQVTRTLKLLTSQILNLTLNTIDSAINIIITLILTIFLTLNGDKIWHGLASWLPAPWDEKLGATLRQSFEGYFAGQATMALISSVTLTIAFWILQVPLALLFGFGIGLFTLIPYGGVLGITIVSVLVSFQDLRLGITALVTSAILGQINDNIIAPRLLGSITGLNPVWIIISIIIGAKLGGILGLLVAVPTASTIKRAIDIWREARVNKASSLTPTAALKSDPQQPVNV
jgi:predicted PurR-regulated permease PerM